MQFFQVLAVYAVLLAKLSASNSSTNQLLPRFFSRAINSTASDELGQMDVAIAPQELLEEFEFWMQAFDDLLANISDPELDITTAQGNQNISEWKEEWLEPKSMEYMADPTVIDYEAIDVAFAPINQEDAAEFGYELSDELLQIVNTSDNQETSENEDEFFKDLEAYINDIIDQTPAPVEVEVECKETLPGPIGIIEKEEGNELLPAPLRLRTKQEEYNFLMGNVLNQFDFASFAAELKDSY